MNLMLCPETPDINILTYAVLCGSPFTQGLLHDDEQGELIQEITLQNLDYNMSNDGTTTLDHAASAAQLDDNYI